MDRISDLSSNQNISMDFITPRFSKKVIISTLILIICGALNTILFKEQTAAFGLPESMISIQVFIIFIGQYMNLIIFYAKILAHRRNLMVHFQKYKNRALISGRRFHFSTSSFAFAAFINCFASLMQLYALVHLSPSSFQMFTGFGVLFTPFISRVILKRRLYRHTAVGILSSLLGLALIVVSSYYFDTTDQHLRENWLSTIVVMILGVFLTSLQRVYEEWLFDKIETSAYRFIGYEGYYGILFLFVGHLTFLAINKQTGNHLADIGLEIMTVLRSKALFISSLFLIISTTVYDLTGVIVTKKVSATYRVVNETARVILVWLIQIFVFDLYNQNIKNLDYMLLTFSKLIGYSLLIFGNVLINEIAEISVCGLNRYFGRYQNSKMEDEMVEESEEFSIMKS